MAVISGFAEDAVSGNELFRNGSVFGSFTAVSAYAFMVFNLFSAPCFGAIGAMKRELGSNKKLLKAICFQTALAWVLATVVYQVGSRLQYFSIADVLITFGIIAIAVLIIKNFFRKNRDKCSTCPYSDNCEKKN